jgi:anti-sigma factor RsiW
MTADEARDLFADAAEGTLGERREAFDAALAADAELAEEYALYQKLMGTTRALGDEEAPDAAAPPLLPAVQKKIRVRSRGRFFKDRFAAEGGDKNTLTLVLTMAVLLLVAATIVVVQNLVVVDLPATSTSE